MKTIVTLAIVALIGAASAHAEVLTKGGATKLFRVPPTQSGITAATVMKCGTCKSEFVRIALPTFKGTVAGTSIVERHACASCGSKWIATGHGKAKVNTAVHTCGGCTM